MTETYHQKIPIILIVYATLSFFFSLMLFVTWTNSGSLLCLFFSGLLFLILIVSVRPIIEWRKITIDNNHIVISKKFRKPLHLKISKSLYEVVLNRDKTIRSFRFRYGEYYTQISPVVYKDGDKMTKKLYECLKKHKLNVDFVHSKI